MQRQRLHDAFTRTELGEVDKFFSRCYNHVIFRTAYFHAQNSYKSYKEVYRLEKVFQRRPLLLTSLLLFAAIVGAAAPDPFIRARAGGNRKRRLYDSEFF